MEIPKQWIIINLIALAKAVLFVDYFLIVDLRLEESDFMVCVFCDLLLLVFQCLSSNNLQSFAGDS